ncbi:MAG: error-prone DNA polymerase [Verrucomicrobiales bacterium]
MYAELHARSAFSFLRGSSQPEALVQRAAALGMGQLVVCDRDGFYGSARVHYAAKECGGMRASVGAEVTLQDGTALPLLVQTREGYQNLCKLITQAQLRSPKGECQVSLAELEAFSAGLCCLTGDAIGPVQHALATQQPKLAEKTLKRLVEIFGRDRVAIEIQRHRVRGEHHRNRQLIDLAAAHRLPVVATNAPLFADRSGRFVADAFTCLRHHVSLDEAGSLLAPNSERFIKNGEMMRDLFADLPRALEQSVRIAETLEFTLENLGYQFPSPPLEPGQTRDSLLYARTYAGASERYRDHFSVKVKAQLEHELGLICRLGFSGYFLIVQDIVNFAREQGFLIQGRGSAANSAVCYSLGITACDPIECKLLFERFLSEGRRSWPDIDLDLPSGDHREAVIQEVYRRFAPRGAAMTANVITYRGRSAMREMGKVLGIPEDILGRFSDLYARGDYKHTLELQQHIEKSGLQHGHPRMPALIKLYQEVHRLPRHLGQHSGGMVICDQGLDTVVPLENASMPGRVVLQWDKDDCEDLGIVKVDLLGLGMMAAIEETIALCASRGKAREVDIAHIPKDDPDTFAMMQAADTVGVFQIESRAQMATLPRMKPKTFYDVVVEVAIIRPGPIVGGLVHPYLNRRAGREPIDYIHPKFQPILERTLGVPLFQEQVLQMAMVIAGFSGSEAEDLRRAMSFHRSPERMAKVMAKLRAAMGAHGVENDVQDRIVSAIQSFALYGFPESHAISFGLLAYFSVWLKAHRAVEFYTALLNNQPMGFYSSATLIKDARRHGVKVFPVNVVHSQVRCTVESDHTLRLGLGQVHGLNTAAAERIIAERNRAPWRSLSDFLYRTQLNRAERRMLARIGALNSPELATHRRDALWQIERFIDPDDLFSYAEWKRQQEQMDTPLDPMDAFERLQSDFAGTGMTTGPHPMGLIRADLPHVIPANALNRYPHGKTVTIAGQVICRQRPSTASGHVFISLEDETGISNAFVPSPTFELYRLTITQEPFLQITGKLQNVDNVISIYTHRVKALPFQARLQSQSHDFH